FLERVRHHAREIEGWPTADMPERAPDSKARRDPEVRYSDHVAVGHNAFKFLFNFGRLGGEDDEAHGQTRIVMGPSHAKEVGRLLDQAWRRYERTYGPIESSHLEDDIQ